jgi:hypothetical protein
MRSDFDRHWRELSEDVLTGMKEWRLQHPRATLNEIEAALDERLARLRARMLEDAALASTAADWDAAVGAAAPVCPQCRKRLQARGGHPRQVQTHGGQSLTLRREYGVCPVCHTGFFPLDEELQLLPGCLTPRLQEQLTRLGSWMAFAKAAEMLEAFTGVAVTEDYVRQHTEAAGAAQVALQTEAVARLEREAPPAPAGPAKLYLSADGAFVPLVGGEWAEVKTLVIGEIAEPVLDARRDEWVVHTRHLSYFSRLTDADTFKRLALVETHRRGVENAGQVGAVQDGAEWLQGFVDWHRPDAVRILDFPHAGGYIGKIGQATFGADTPELAAWLKTRFHELKHQGPTEVLAELQEMVREHPGALELPGALAYLEKRQPQMQYPTFQAHGWPIGSGATESGNKSVVEARLKGAGMHWACATSSVMTAGTKPGRRLWRTCANRTPRVAPNACGSDVRRGPRRRGLRQP